jgi:hypothetical protein
LSYKLLFYPKSCKSSICGKQILFKGIIRSIWELMGLVEQGENSTNLGFNKLQTIPNSTKLLKPHPKAFFVEKPLQAPPHIKI